MKCPRCYADNPDTCRYCGSCAAPLGDIGGTGFSDTRTLEGPAQAASPGTIIAGKYRILEEIGRGGMGVVYKAEDIKLIRPVALKFLPPQWTLDPQARERFVHEARAASALDHPNICTIYEIGEAEDRRMFIVMACYEGESLREKVRHGPLESDEAIGIAVQVAQGMAKAHLKGIIHRDIKPANILISNDGTAKIVDFGLAKLAGQARLTREGSTVGTAAYMSPEQARGDAVDQRTDIWSLGVVLYELLSGRLPFKGDYERSLIHSILTSDPEPVSKIRKDLPKGLEQIIFKSLSKNPSLRYQSMGELAKDLKTVAEGLGPLPAGPSLLVLGLKKGWVSALTITLAVTIIAGLVLWAPWKQKKAVLHLPDRPSVAVMYFRNNTGDPNLDHWRMMLSNLLIADLSQSRHIRVLSEERLYQMLSEWNQLEATTFSSSILKRIADRSRVNRIIQGAFAKAGSAFRINVTLQQADSGEIMGAEDVSGTGEASVFSMVDELTRRIKSHFALSREAITEDVDMKVETITTGSTEALRCYTEGRRYHQKGDFSKSIAMMMKAVEIDPEFALAYRSLASSYNNLGEITKSKSFNQKAFDVRNRLSDRERYLVEGAFYSDSEMTYDKAIEADSKLLGLYPDDVFGNNSLGTIYLDLEEYDKAIPFFEKAIESQRINALPNLAPYFNLSLTYMYRGMYKKAETVLRTCLREVPDTGMIRDLLARLALIQGKYDLAVDETDKAMAARPIVHRHERMKGDIAFLRDHLDMAEEHYHRLLGLEGTTAKVYGMRRLASVALLRGRFQEAESWLEQGMDMMEKLGEKERVGQFSYYLGYVHLKSGRPEKAFEDFDKTLQTALAAGDLGTERVALFGKSMARIETKSWERAQGLADELQASIKKAANQKTMRLFYHLEGLMELSKGNHSKAITDLKKALSLLSHQSSTEDVHAPYIDPLARAYYESGDYENARQEYEKIVSLTSGRFEYGDIYAKSFFMLGKIFDRNGDRTRAEEFFKKFLSLWRDADPGIPEVLEAKRILEGGK